MKYHENILNKKGFFFLCSMNLGGGNPELIFVTPGCYHGTVLLFSAVPPFLLYSFDYQGLIKVTSDHNVIEGRRKREIGGERANCQLGHL